MAQASDERPHSAIDLAGDQPRVGGENQPDCLCMLMWGDWETQLRSNRWHYARRWTRHLPVLMLEPVRPHWPAAVEIKPDRRIERCEVLQIAASRCQQATRTSETAVQLAETLAALAARGYRRPLLWLYNPWLAELYAALPAVGRVMHFTEPWFEFYDTGKEFHDLTRRALLSSDLVVAVSSGVEQSIRRQVPAAAVHTVSNGCDFAEYAAAQADGELAALGRGYRRTAVFAGNIDRRVDYELSQQLAIEQPSTLFAFYGRLGELTPDAEPARSELFALPNVRYLGPRPPEQLPAIYAAASLGIVPYHHDRQLVESGFALKVLEMAATGLPVVTSEMRPLRGLAAAICVAANADQFLEQARRLDRVQLTAVEREELVNVARKNDYDVKFASVRGLVETTLQLHRERELWLSDKTVGGELRTWRDAYRRWWAQSEKQDGLRVEVPVLAASESWAAAVWLGYLDSLGLEGAHSKRLEIAEALLRLRAEVEPTADDARIRLALATSLRHVGRYVEAAQQAEAAEQLAFDKSPNDRRLRAETLLERAALERQVQAWDAAQPLLRRAVDVLQAPGLEDLRADALYRLGATLRAAQVTGEAVQVLEQAVALYRQRGTAERPALVGAMFELGCGERQLGHYAKAAQWLQQAMEIQTELHGREHWLVALVLVEHAAALRALGELEAAFSELDCAARLYAQHFGDEHAAARQVAGELAAVTFDLAEQLHRRHDPLQARQIYERLIARLRSARANGPLTRALVELGKLLREQGLAEQAIEHLREASMRHLALPDADPCSLAKIRAEEALARAAAGELIVAADLLDESIAVYTRYFGANHEAATNLRLECARLTALLGGRARQTQCLEEAELWFRKSLEHLKSQSDETAELAYAARDLGAVLTALGRWFEAIEPLSTASRILTEKRDDAALSATLVDLGSALRKAGRPVAAAAELARAVELRRAAHGPQHWLVAEALIEEALAHDAEGDARGALAQLEEALEIQGLHFGPESEAAQSVVQQLERTARADAPQIVRRWRARVRERSVRGQLGAIVAWNPHAPQIGTLRWQLGMALAEQDRHEEAEAELALALPNIEHHGYPHDVAAALVDHGQALRLLGRFEPAQARLQRAIELAAGCDQPQPWTIGCAELELARIRQAAADFNAALALAKRAAAALHLHLHPSLETTERARAASRALFTELAVACLEAGRWIEAHEAAREGVLRLRHSDAGGVPLAAALAALGTSLRHLGRAEESLTAIEEAAVIYTRQLDENSLADVWLEQSLTLAALGRATEALEQAERGIALTERIHGAHDHHTAAALRKHALTLIALDRRDDAAEVLTTALAIQREHWGMDHPATRPLIALVSQMHVERFAQARLSTPALEDHGPDVLHRVYRYQAPGRTAA